MSVTDFECAIARSQINRYVAGDTLAGDVIQQLEAHLGMCGKCKRVLEEKKSSLMAMLTAPETVEQRPLSLPEERVAMATSSPYVMPVETFDTKQKLRQQLEDRQREVATHTSTETVAAFAYHDPEVVEVPTKKPSRFASAFALFKRVDDEEVDSPKLTKASLSAAKQQLSKQKGGFAKPVAYLVGLVAVAGAMAFFLKDPTALFGAKATAPNLLVRKTDTPAAKPAKKVRRSPEKNTVAETWKKVRAPKSGTASQSFAPDVPAKAPTKQAAVTKAPVAKTTTEPKATTASAKSTKRTSKPIVRRKPKAQNFATEVSKSTPKKTTKRRSTTTTKSSRPKSASKPKIVRDSDEGSIKIYEPEGGN
jgi:hypothetical protein